MLPALFQPGDPGLTAPKCSSWQGGDRLRSSPRRNSPSDLGLEDGPDDDDEDDCALWQPDCNCLFALALLLRSHSGATSRTPWLPRAKPTVPSRPGLPSRPSLERKRERSLRLHLLLFVFSPALLSHTPFRRGKTRGPRSTSIFKARDSTQPQKGVIAIDRSRADERLRSLSRLRSPDAAR